jgi:hypothetical protein
MVMEKLTDDEHHARAMLLGMRYHHGNGEPFYYFGDDGVPDVNTFIDANTMEPMIDENTSLTKKMNLFMDASQPPSKYSWQK